MTDNADVQAGVSPDWLPLTPMIVSKYHLR